MGVKLLSGQCYVFGTLSENNLYYPYDLTFHIEWRQAISSPITKFDHVIPHYSSSGVCSGTGTTLYVYE